MYARFHGGALAALLLAASSTPAQQPSRPQQTQPAPQASAHLTHEQAVADTRTFLRLLEATHPDPYTSFGGKIAFKRKAQEMITSLPAGGLSVGTLATRLGMFLAPLRDGHTNVGLYNTMWRSGKDTLPVRFQVTSDAFFVAASNVPEMRGTRGARVLGVNGHPMAELLERLAAHVGTENAYGLARLMARTLQTEALLELLIPEVARTRSVTYDVEMPNGQRENRTVAFGGTHSADPSTWLEKPVRWPGLKRSSDLFYYRMLDSGRTAYFRVASMGGREAVQTYRHIELGGPAMLRQILEAYYELMRDPMPADVGRAIAGIPSVVETGTAMLNEMKRAGTASLVIDLRGNGGGMTGVLYPLLYQLYGDGYFRQTFPNQSVTVMSQLYMDFFSVDSTKERAKNPEFEVGWYRFNEPEAQADSGAAARGTPEWARARREASLAQWEERGYSGMNGLRALDGQPLYRPKHVVVLVDPATFSAGFQIEFYLHGLGATLVGVPSGQSPNAFMQVTPFTLPASRLTGSISNSTQVFMPDTPDARVLPVDFEATYSVFRTYDFDEDASLRYALDLLRQGRIR